MDYEANGRRLCGPHHICLNCNENNLGLAGNINGAFQMSRGEIIVLAGGDDISVSDRVERSVGLLNSDPKLTCVSFNTIKLRHSGNLALVDQVSAPRVDAYELKDLIKDSPFIRMVQPELFDEE